VTTALQALIKKHHLTSMFFGVPVEKKSEEGVVWNPGFYNPGF
jgi:hypothetical protein